MNGIDYSLTIYDTAGLEQQAQIPQQYIKSHGFILAYSINDPQRYEQKTTPCTTNQMPQPSTKKKQQNFYLISLFFVFFSFQIVSDIYIRLVDELGSTQIPIVLIGNKTDLNEQRRITYEAGMGLVQQWKDAGSQAAFMETSALTGEVKLTYLIFSVHSLLKRLSNSIFF